MSGRRLTESTAFFVFTEKIDGLPHEIVRLSYHRLELSHSRELLNVDDVIYYVGHADNELDYFFVSCVLNVQDLLASQLTCSEYLFVVRTFITPVNIPMEIFKAGWSYEIEALSHRPASVY